MYYVDLRESFQTHIYLQNLASIQPRTSPATFAAVAGKAPLAAKAPGAGKARPPLSQDEVSAPEQGKKTQRVGDR